MEPLKSVSTSAMMSGPHILAMGLVFCAFLVKDAHLNFSVPVGICPTGWIFGPSANKCYKVITKNQAGTKLSWNHALCFCDELDATLAKVTNAYVEKELQSLAPGVEYHIGLRFDHGAKKWLWRDGSEAQYFNWLDGLWNKPHWGPCVVKAEAAGTTSTAQLTRR